MALEPLTLPELRAFDESVEDRSGLVLVLTDGTTLYGRFEGLGPTDHRSVPEGAVRFEYTAPRGPPKPKYTGVPASRTAGFTRLAWEQERIEGDTPRDERSYHRGSLRGALRERTGEAVAAADLPGRVDALVTTEEMKRRRFDWAPTVEYPPGTLLACAFTALSRQGRLDRVGVAHLDSVDADERELGAVLAELNAPATPLDDAPEAGSRVTVEGYPNETEGDEDAVVRMTLAETPDGEPSATCWLRGDAFVVPPEWVAAAAGPVRVHGRVVRPRGGERGDWALHGCAVGTPAETGGAP